VAETAINTYSERTGARPFALGRPRSRRPRNAKHLVPRVPQRGLSLFLLGPAGVGGLGSLLELPPRPAIQALFWRAHVHRRRTPPARCRPPVRSARSFVLAASPLPFALAILLLAFVARAAFRSADLSTRREAVFVG
jgi:hypothetical protein